MLHILTPPLLADIGEVLGGIAALVGLILWIIQKIGEANKAAAQPRQPRPPAPPPQAAGQGGAQLAGQQADPLRNQVEEFLRRAGQAKQQANQNDAQPRPPGQPAREIEVLIDDETPTPPRRAVGAPMRSMQSRPASASPPVEPGDRRPARRSVTPRIRKTLAERSEERAAARTQSIANQVSHLGQRIIAEDQQFDDQLKAKFDHVVGTLAATSISSTEPVPVRSETPASQIAAMLANPEGVRQAIILNEVLRRPTDRW